MSSTYSAICLSHDPALVIDREIRRDAVDHLDNRDGLDGHQTCDIVIGRFSYPLIEVACLGRQLPGPSGCTRHHSGVEWVDSDWLRLLHAARPHTDGDLLRRHTFGCWPADRLNRLRDELALPEPTPAAPQPEPADDINITDYLVVRHYRTDRGAWAWSWRCWGDGACDGHLALDLSNRDYAERKAREHLATEHPAAAAVKAG